MQTIHISSKGQVIISKSIHDEYQLDARLELEVEIVTQGILFKIKNKHPQSTLNVLISYTGYQGNAKPLDEMKDSI